MMQRLVYNYLKMPSLSELEHLLETSLSRRDLLLLGTTTAVFSKLTTYSNY